MNRDLTEGKPDKVLWRFCLPLFGSIIFQQLYNIADSFVAGKFIGENALASVGNSYELTLVFIAFAFGCNVGCSVITARLFGAKKYVQMKTAVSTTMIAGGVLCIVLTALGLVFEERLLLWIHTPAEVMADSLLYLRIYLLGFPFVLFYNISTGIFSALGDSKTPFVFLMFSSVGNIAVDILFVCFFRLGVSGVAWATFLCQGISGILAVIFVFLRLRTVKSEKAGLFSFTALGQVAAIAVPSILQQSFISVGNIIIQGMINSYGSAVMAGYSASVKMNNLVVTSFTTLGNGMSNYTAQNLGAGKANRVRAGYRAGLKIVWLICIPFILLFFFGGEYLMQAFIDQPTQTAVATGVDFLRILSPFYFMTAAKLVADGILRGAGKMGFFMASTLSALVLRVGLAYLFSAFFGVTGIWAAWPAGWGLGLVLSTVFYRKMCREYAQ